jgi:hypothetical protein
MNPTLGCVIALRDREPEYLTRALQTYDYQTVQPADKLVVDYGSSPEAAAAYRALCERHAWRYQAVRPRSPRWSSSAAYNSGVASLNPEVDLVFKCDVDILLGRNVLETACRLGSDKLCLFPCLTTAEGTVYPPRFRSHEDLVRLLGGSSPPLGMWGEGIHAFPRPWFESVGGYDLEFELWGYEDSDLCERARWSIGVVPAQDTLLIHQWHPRRPVGRARRNKEYFDRMRESRRTVRNGGFLLPPPCEPERIPVAVPSLPSSERAGALRTAVVIRTDNEFLFRATSELLASGPEGGAAWSLYRLREGSLHSGFDSVLRLNADWVVLIDQGLLVLSGGRLADLIRHLDQHGLAACEVPDAGPPHGRPFFHAFDLRRVSPTIPPPRHGSGGDVDPYGDLVRALQDAGERILYLDPEPWEDEVSSVWKSFDGQPLFLDGGLRRPWEQSYHIRRRFRTLLSQAREASRLAVPTSGQEIPS